MERHDRSLEIRSVHEHVVCDDHVESVILDCGKLGARIHMEVCCGIGRSRKGDSSPPEAERRRPRGPDTGGGGARAENRESPHREEGAPWIVSVLTHTTSLQLL